MKEHEPVFFFLTQNLGKYAEASKIAAEYGIALKRLGYRYSKVEIQSNDLRAIATFAAQQACQATGRPILADDSGFFIRALGGFPGPYSSYVYKTIGNNGILRLLSSANQRTANFRAAVAFCKPRTRPVCFTGRVNGTVSRRKIGTTGFGFDPIFVPDEGDGRTFAQMGIAEKNRISHRARAFTDFFNWLHRNENAVR